MGFIPTTHQTDTYFDVNYHENMLGLAPTQTTDTNLLARQFLYSFVSTSGQTGLQESYLFDGGVNISIGGTQAEFAAVSCFGGDTSAGNSFSGK